MVEKILKRLTADYWMNKMLRQKIKMLHPIYQKYIVPRKVKTLRKKNIIKVLFVIHELGSWKTENLYVRMKQHPRFDVKLLLLHANDCAYSYEIAKNYLEEKGYAYEILSYGESIKKKLNPDIIFYGKPYIGILDRKHFFANNLYALFCYVNYGFRNRNSQHHRKIVFFDFTWQLYAENNKIIEEWYHVINTKGRNMVNTGLPIMDILLQNKKKFEDPWKSLLGNRKRIIYAPHHTLKIDNVPFSSPFYYATFLEFGDYMLEMANKYKKQVQWAFKPHPLLRGKLYCIWGKERTDSYFQRWAEMENCQIDEGEYLGLFKHSDAMIHDCGSFKLEYLYTDNPVMYLVKKDPEYDFENWQTTKALELHYIGYDKQDIEQFIQNVIDGKDVMKGARKEFVDTYLTPPNGKSACDNIINSILGEEEYA